MSKDQLRAGQLITTFGPGAMIDFPKESVIVSGLDNWRYRSLDDAMVIEPRLIAKLRKLLDLPDLALRRPPTATDDPSLPPTFVVGWRFPEWFIVQKAERGKHGRRRRLVHLNTLQNGRFREGAGKADSVVPVRWVRACPKGHAGDIDWKAFLQHEKEKRCAADLWVEERGTSGDLADISIVCDCGKERRMSQAAQVEMRSLGYCDGKRPWLGPGTRDTSCGEFSRLLIRSASNAYFPQLLTVISIPDAAEGIDRAVTELWENFFSDVEDASELPKILKKPAVAAKLSEATPEQVWAAIGRKKSGSPSDERPVKEVEFDALTDARAELGADEPGGDFFARRLPAEKWSDGKPWMAPIERVVLVHRLREVVAQVGFTRFEAAGPDIEGELSIDVQTAPLSLESRWLPAVENRGEGVFLQFRAADIKKWLERADVRARGKLLDQGFKFWQGEHTQSERQFPGLPYYLLHSFSHLLLSAISLECGYPASSLRERVFAANGRYGVLIYTGSSDAEGTLGGLVLAGRDIARQVQRALEMASLCSNDPVCAFHEPKEWDHQPLHGSACHGCLLISETCCEQRNEFLDRSLVVPTVRDVGGNFFL